MSSAGFVIAIAAALFGAAQAPAPSNHTIAAALLPLPEQLRAGATVVQLDREFRPVVLRKGTNGMVCIADRPDDDRFDVRCYKDAFIPVVYRAFQLGYQVSGEKVEAEIKTGKLALSNEPTAGYRCLGPVSGFDASRNAVNTQIECWQSIHFPFRTAAELGVADERDITESQQREIPYVMSSGKYWSHVMIRHPTVHEH
jgi:hypothetical protein